MISQILAHAGHSLHLHDETAAALIAAAVAVGLALLVWKTLQGAKA